MYSEDQEKQRRERLASAAQEAAAAAEHAAAVHAALDDGLRDLMPSLVASDPRAFDIASRELDAAVRELDAARAHLSETSEALQAASASFRAMVTVPVFELPPADLPRTLESFQEAHVRAKDRVAMLELVVAELTQLRSAILRGQ